MSLIADIIQFENNYARSFASVAEREYGRLFYDRDNPESHDSNHAKFSTLEVDLDAAIGDICAFYDELRVRPRVYHGFVRGGFEILRPKLLAAGFRSELSDEQYFVWTSSSEIRPVPGFELRRLRSLNQEIVDVVGPEETWTLGVLERQIPRLDCHLLALYVDGVAVGLAQIDMIKGLSRVDGVTIHPQHRRQGYGRALMHGLVQYHREISDNVLYLYSSNSTAIRIYSAVGFSRLDWNPRKWSAWLPEA